jgi:hypothetical protein
VINTDQIICIEIFALIWFEIYNTIVREVLRKGDSGGKLSILGDDSIDILKKKFHMNMCLILNGY